MTLAGAGESNVEGLVGADVAVTTSGAGNHALTGIDCKSLTLELTGAGNTSLQGKADRLDAHIRGAGNIDAARLQAGDVKVKVSGAGHATVWATENLTAELTGAGGIHYKARPASTRRSPARARFRQ